MNFWRHLSTPIIGLSPMDGVTDAAFRHIVATHGRPDVMFTEFTHVADMCHGRVAGWEPLKYSDQERPIVAQLYGKDPQLFYQAAQIVCELGFDGLDINMGCPSKNVASSGSGAGLIRTPELALHIVAATHRGIQDWTAGQSLSEGGLKPAIVNQVRERQGQHGSQRAPAPSQRKAIPLSVKTRLGYDSVIIDEWCDCLIQGKPEAISIHGRTLEQMYRGTADWEAIGRVAPRIQKHGILVLGNGDIRSLGEAKDRITTYSVDGVLIGRAALGNPWIFQDIPKLRQAIHDNMGCPNFERNIDRSARFRMMMEHARYFECLNKPERFPRMRKHLGWYCSGFPHAAAMRARMVRTNGSRDVETVLNEYQMTQSLNPHLTSVECPLAS